MKCATITFVVTLILLLALTALDIAMFTINKQNQCTLGTEDGMRQYVNFGLSAWMYWASITHFSVLSFILISAALGALFLYFFETHLEGDPYGGMARCITCCWGGITFCIFVMVDVFLLVWTVIGFLLQEEIRNHGVNNVQCNQVLLAWCIVSILSHFGCFGSLCFVVYGIATA